MMLRTRYPRLVKLYQQVTFPTGTGVFFAAHPVTITGNEVEGGTATLTTDTTQTLFVNVQGSRAPLVGEYYVARWVPNRWVAERMKVHVYTCGSIPGTCLCSGIPSTLHMTASNPALNSGNFQSSDLICQPLPSWASGFGITTASGNVYMSPTSFTEGAGTFWYLLGCNAATGFYVLLLLNSSGFLDPLGGAPVTSYSSAPYWYKWIIGVPGNTCSPYILAHGQMYTGGNTADVVNITQ